jgi:hypothetical protein
MEMSESIADFAKAMATVQADIGGAFKGKTNPAFKSKYADLSAVWDTWQAIGPAAGFSIMQFPGDFNPEARTMGMDQIVTHSSGQWIRSHLSVPLTKTDAQGYGSACTYARRYSLAAAVGICPEDDDGNAASQSRGASVSASSKVITKAQLTELQKLVSDTGTDCAALCEYYKVESLPELPSHRFEHAKGVLVKRLPEQMEAA